MTDFSRTFAQLKELFPNNTEGNISAQDLRDFLESVFQYGGIDMHPSDTPTGGQTIGTAYTKITQFPHGEHAFSSDISVSAANDNITIARGGIYVVLCQVSFSGSANSTWTGSLFVNGVDQDHIGFTRKLAAGGDVGSTIGIGLHMINDDDVLDYRVKADAASKNFTLQSGSFFVFRIG